MKTLFLIFTILFSFSVLADCCNTEIQFSGEESHTYQTDGTHCGDTSEHGAQAQHCHCSPLNHLKILASEKIVITLPSSEESSLNGFIKPFQDSLYVNTIFHPPIV